MSEVTSEGTSEVTSEGTSEGTSEVIVVCLYPDRDPAAMRVNSEGNYIARTLGEGSTPTFLGSSDDGGETGIFLMGDANAQRPAVPPVDILSIPPSFSTDNMPLRGMLVITKLRYHGSTLPKPVDYTLEEYSANMRRS